MEDYKVLIADAIDEKGIESLREVGEVDVKTDISPEELLQDIENYNAIVVRSRTKLTREVIEAAINLKIIARAGVGVDNIDMEAATEKGIMVVNAPESTSITVAEHALGIMLSCARKLHIADKSVKSNKWEKSKFMGVELNGKTLGVIGMGRIGSQVVSRCKAFGMDVIVYDPYLNPELANKMGVGLTTLEDVLKKADFITIHVPLTDETKHLISTKELESMKNTAFIINCARGGIIDEDALYNALKDNKIGGAGLDVFEIEPPKGSKLLELDNIIVTPHIGASTKEAQSGAAIMVADEIIKVFKGESPKNVLNMPILDNESFQTMKPYLKLCEKLGIFLSQVVKGTINEVEVITCGEVANIAKKEVLTRKVLQGVLAPMRQDPVNMISAPIMAKNMGINVIEGEGFLTSGYQSLIKVKVKTEKDEFQAEGTDLHGPRLIRVNGYWVDVIPEGNMFIAKYKDVPGSIGSIGTIFGENNVNIGVMQVGRDETGGEAIMILTVDTPVENEIVKKIEELPNVHDAKSLKLN